jgi:hypothetical protein
MKAPMVGIPFRLYIVAEDAVIGAVLTQITGARNTSLHTLADALLMLKRGILSLKSCVYLYSMLAPNYGITC